MFGRSKPPTEEMIALQEEKDYAGALQLALRYMGETNKPLKKYDPNFLFQTASVYYNLDDILSVEKPSVKLEGVDRIEEIFRITDEIPNDWIAYHEVLFLRGRCFLEINRFDEAEEIFNALYSNSIQISLKIIKAFGEDAVIIIETLLLSAYAFAETFSNPLISKLCIGMDESDFSIIKECSVICPIPEGINNSKCA